LRSRLFVLVICLAGLAGAGIASYGAISRHWFGAPASPSFISKGQSGQRSEVSALGRIEPESEIINLGAGTPPDRLDSLFVARGDLVKKDQVLGYVGGYAEQIAQRDVYRAQLEEATLRLKAETALNQARIEAAEARQRQILEVMPHRIAAQEATIAGLEARLANDKDILESQLQLLSRGSASRRQSEDQKTSVLQNEASLRAARARLSELQRQFEHDKIDAAVQVQLARATLERMQVEFPTASLERQIALAEARAKRLTLYAPVDGRILNVRVKPGEEIGSSPILAMGNTERMRAVAEIYETDIAQVRVGQSATVKSRALPNPISGKVVRIGNMVFKNDVLSVDPAARADARVVEVWIDLDDPVPAQRLSNLTVDVVINTSGSDASAVR
jgi:HlyD family secretion protein